MPLIYSGYYAHICTRIVIKDGQRDGLVGAGARVRAVLTGTTAKPMPGAANAPPLCGRPYERNDTTRTSRGERVIRKRMGELIRTGDKPDIGVLQLEETDLETLNHLKKLEDDIFGEEAVGEWFLVSHIRHGNVLVLVEISKRKPIGIAILMRDWDDLRKCYLADFGIKETRRGMGLGKYFLGVVLKDVGEQGFKKVSLTVDVKNEVAIRLYRRFGFEVVEERRNLYGEGRHRYVMEVLI